VKIHPDEHQAGLHSSAPGAFRGLWYPDRMRPAIKIRIVGDGVAARGCARLLDGRGFGLMLERSPRPKVPAIMIGRTTQGLFRDTFGQDDLFRGFPAITRRVVA